MAIEFSFASIDAKESQVLEVDGIPMTAKNHEIRFMAERDYLERLAALQREIIERYRSQFETEGEDIDWEEADDLDMLLSSKYPLSKEADRLWYS